MQNTCLFLTLLSLLKMCSCHVPSVQEILRTEQYLLVSQQDNYTFVESNIPSGKCPFVFTKPKVNRIEQYRYIGTHLVRDLEGNHPPRIMVIKSILGATFIEVFALNVTEMLNNELSQPAAFLKTIPTKKDVVSTPGVAIRGTLFDSSNHMLYIDHSTPETIEIRQYFVQGVFSGSHKTVYVGKHKISSPNSRYEWSEDQYEQKFYYKEKIDNEVHVFSIPMNSYILTIMDGVAGKDVGALTDDGVMRGATGGAFFTISRKPSNKTNSLFASLVPSNLGAGMSCKVLTSQKNMPSFQYLIVIRNNDFCMLRDGSDYSKEDCEEKQKQYLIDIGDGANDVVKWLLIVCIVMFMLIILLFVYIYWLRSTFISESDRTHPNEYETEASLFVAKQRSFPSAYQDPALMDVSVDRWN